MAAILVDLRVNCIQVVQVWSSPNDQTVVIFMNLSGEEVARFHIDVDKSTPQSIFQEFVKCVARKDRPCQSLKLVLPDCTLLDPHDNTTLVAELLTRSRPNSK